VCAKPDRVSRLRSAISESRRRGAQALPIEDINAIVAYIRNLKP
jgi:hypothetical protein